MRSEQWVGLALIAVAALMFVVSWWREAGRTLDRSVSTALAPRVPAPRVPDYQANIDAFDSRGVTR